MTEHQEQMLALQRQRRNVVTQRITLLAARARRLEGRTPAHVLLTKWVDELILAGRNPAVSLIIIEAKLESACELQLALADE
jgi:hypothetical protein